MGVLGEGREESWKQSADLPYIVRVGWIQLIIDLCLLWLSCSRCERLNSLLVAKYNMFSNWSKMTKCLSLAGKTLWLDAKDRFALCTGLRWHTPVHTIVPQCIQMMHKIHVWCSLHIYTPLCSDALPVVWCPSSDTLSSALECTAVQWCLEAWRPHAPFSLTDSTLDFTAQSALHWTLRTVHGAEPQCKLSSSASFIKACVKRKRVHRCSTALYTIVSFPKTTQLLKVICGIWLV